MRALSLPTQFILFLLVQGVLGFVFYLIYKQHPQAISPYLKI
jgi:hypothetical protein